MKPIKTVCVVLFRDDQVLLVRHGEAAGHLTGTYGLPAGRLEPGESNTQAAIRELQEETGLVAQPRDVIELPTVYIATLERKDGPKTFIGPALLCLDASGELRSNSEATPFWAAYDQIGSYELIGNVGAMIKDARVYYSSENDK